MNKMLINYCYSWYRTARRTNVLTRTDVSIAELTSEPTGRATTEGDSPSNDRGRQAEGTTEGDSPRERPRATARGNNRPRATARATTELSDNLWGICPVVYYI